eukprot:GEMP01007453.1.p1 GENE.GEMP01007453.1~~GEMP01007453.1.p1  ORF type:complete len:865 (+),score=155.28 GEMP01007453.1:119-2713(+)
MPSLITCDSGTNFPQLGVSSRDVDLPFSPRSLATPSCLLSSSERMEVPKATRSLATPFYDWMPNPAPHWAFTNIVVEKKCPTRIPKPEVAPFHDEFESSNVLCRNFVPLRLEALRKAGGQQMRTAEKNCAESCRNYIRQKDEATREKTKQRKLAHQRRLVRIAEQRSTPQNLFARADRASCVCSSNDASNEGEQGDFSGRTGQYGAPEKGRRPLVSRTLRIASKLTRGGLPQMLTRSSALANVVLTRPKSERMKSIIAARKKYMEKNKLLNQRLRMLQTFVEMPQETQDLFQNLWLAFAVPRAVSRDITTDPLARKTTVDAPNDRPKLFLIEENDHEDWRITPRTIGDDLLLSILASAGLKAHNLDEKMVIVNLVDKLAKVEHVHDGGIHSVDYQADTATSKKRKFECTLVEIAVDIISKVRTAFVEGATPSHQDAFTKYAEENGLMEIARAKTLVYELASPIKVRKTISALANEKKLHETFSSKYREMPKFPNGSLGVNFALFQSMVQQYREVSTSARYVAEDAVAIRYSVPHDLTQGNLRGQLANILSIFKKSAIVADDHGEEMLPSELLSECLDEMGITPKNWTKRANMLALLSSKFPCCRPNMRLTFVELLEACTAARDLNFRASEMQIRAKFKSFDSDESNTLDLSEFSDALCQLGVAPKTREDQEVLATMMVTVDEDSVSKTLTLSEFAILYSRIEEGLHSSQYKREIEQAARFGFSRVQLSTFRTAFAELDMNGSGGIEISELRTLMDLLHVNISAETLREKFRLLDKDESGVLEFYEFLRLMHILNTDDVKSFATRSQSVDRWTLAEITVQEERHQHEAEKQSFSEIFQGRKLRSQASEHFGGISQKLMDARFIAA